MVKHNNIIPGQHFRKDWQRYVRTWFSQPAKKSSRRAARLSRAKAVAPRPLELLRPIVRAPTVQYNSKLRAGRGFTLAELKAAKINKKAARGIGIAVDHRRKNRSEEGFTLNVNRLKLYSSKLLLFPRNPSSSRVKKGDSKPEELGKAQQVDTNEVFPIHQPLKRLRARKITKDERLADVTKVLRKALTDQKRKGAREKRAKDKADEAAGKKQKGGGGGGGGDGGDAGEE